MIVFTGEVFHVSQSTIGDSELFLNAFVDVLGDVFVEG